MTTTSGPEFDPDDWSPVTLGPTWQQDEDGKYLMPERSLGSECLKWTYEFLKGPGGGPWKFSPEQARMVMWWYAIDEHGNWLYEDGVIQRVKGWGKDPWAAALIAFELCGPCRFSHWGEDGKPVAKQPNEPWIQVAAVSREQTKNTMKIFAGLFTDACKKKYALKISRVIIHAQGGIGRIEAVTSSPETLEGGRPSLLVMNETHWWNKSNDGLQMALTGRANAGKVGGRALAITNAPQPGYGSVAEIDRKAYDDWRSGKFPDATDPRTFYDSLEAPANAPLTKDVIPIVLAKVRGDSFWLNIARTMREILDPRTPLSRSRRFYYNQIVAAEDALVTAGEWDPCEGGLPNGHHPNVPKPVLKDGDEITLGLDGGSTDDATALVAIRIRDRAVFKVYIWEKPHGEDGADLSVDMLVVDDLIAACFRKYKVRAFFSDVHPISSWVEKWSELYREVLLVKAAPGKSAVGFDMRGNGPEITRMNEVLVGAIRGGAIVHDGDPHVREHVLNAIQHENGYGMSFRKESRESDRKVDAWAAMLLAYIALNKYLESGKKPKEKSGKAWFF